jgi:hypothetical protein
MGKLIAYVVVSSALLQRFVEYDLFWCVKKKKSTEKCNTLISLKTRHRSESRVLQYVLSCSFYCLDFTGYGNEIPHGGDALA